MNLRDLPQLLAEPLAAHLNEVATAPPTPARIDGILVGELIGFRDAETPLVVFPGQSGSAALPARTIPDVRGEHIGREVVLQFEAGDPWRPIIMGCLQKPSAWPLVDQPSQVEVDADGQRLTLTTKEQLVLRCGKASITLTKAGKVLIHGTYLLSRSSGVNRIKGGSVQLN